MTTSVSQKQVWTIETLVKWATDDFRARGIENPRLDAEVIVAWALGIDRVRIILDGKRPLVGDELSRLRELVKRRRAHEPVAYLRGEREFYGRAFKVDGRVLIPRPDTETLVDVALERTRDVSMSMRALDLCTGSGCVAITLARQRPTSRVHGTDVSPGALLVARANALRLGAYNASFSEGDLYAAVSSLAPQARTPGRCRFDVITANPPYIPTPDIPGLSPDIKDFEPTVALDGGPDGLSFLRRIVDGAPDWLVPGGVLAVEVGAEESEEVARCFAARGFGDVRRARDYGKIERVVSGVWT
jgi:release factor glutamine methyltransferase